MQTAYLDNNATTKPAPEVIAAMVPLLEEFYGNPSSVHRFGQRARQAIDEARTQVAQLIDARDAEITFTGGGTEAINTAIRGILMARSPRKRVVISSVEHSATRELCKQLTKEGNEIVEIDVDQQGTLDMDQLRGAISDDVALVSIMWANNETGVIFPVEEIAIICRDARVPFHCDATQAIGKIPVSAVDVPVDAMCFAAHKFHGPKGVGGMYTRRGLRFRPLVIGGPQEHSRRGGTENVAGIAGMGVAARLAKESLPKMAQVGAMRDRLEREILARIPRTRINGATGLAADGQPRRVPNTSNIAFAQLEAEAILLLLSEQGVYASAGAACSSGSLEPSPVLRAMKIDDRWAHGSIRFSLSRYTTDNEIDCALAVLPGIIDRLRAVLPVAAAAP